MENKKKGDSTQKRKLKIFSFFSGIGILDLGFETNGYEIELVNEYHPSFMYAYKYSREKMGLKKPIYGYYQGDVNEFLGACKKELDCWVKEAKSDNSLVGFIGGPPCPDFSVAGKNRGRNGDNGKLSLSYVNLIIQMQPDFFLFENVKGLWRTTKHREFYDELKMDLNKAGYATTNRLTNALEYGAPQDRERILLFGIKSTLLSNTDIKTFPWRKYQRYSVEEIKELPWPETDKFICDSDTTCPPGIYEELTVEHWFEKNHVKNHPNERDYFTPHTGLARMQTIDEGDVSKKSYKRLHRWRYSPTVAYGNNEVHLHPYKERRISAAEAMALQTLPERFELPENMTLTDKFKAIGNGVPYVLASGVAMSIKDFLNGI